MARLVGSSREATGLQFELGKDVLIGRSEECEVRIAHSRISRRHARLVAQEGGYFLTDLQTANGTFVNGRRISGVRLSHGDRVRLGDHELTFLEEGAAPKAIEPTQIEALLNETVLMVQESAAQRGIIEVCAVVEAAVPQVRVDATALKRVVLNLLTNALEACSEGGRVRVVSGMDPTGQHCRITVQDTGRGMSDEVKRHLFEPLFTTKGSRGTGLGLALVKKIVEEHHGRVEVESEPGKGTAFHIILPRDQAGSPTAEIR